MSNQKIRCAAVFSALFIAEFLIAFYAHGWLRFSFGDILVMPTMYYFVRIFTEKFKKALPIILFVFACIVELLQGIHICDILGIHDGNPLRIIIGTTALFSDILCYACGSVIIYAVMPLSHFISERRIQNEC